MSTISPALLPEGLRDRLPPEAEAAAVIRRAVLDVTAAHGYERVEPPLVEFEANLVGRLKAARSLDLLRFLDPVSQHTLALRPDITAQIGRIAATRMARQPRPLRLTYAGQVLKVRGTQLRPEREMTQAGAELLGSDTLAAVAEILIVALEALAATGATGLSVDLTLPDLVPTLAAGAMPLPPENIEAVQAQLDGKDAAGLPPLGASAYLPLIQAAGPLAAALERLEELPGHQALDSRIEALRALGRIVGSAAEVTLDPTERHGFEYQSWIGFSLFCNGVRGEVGRGGSYAIVHADGREEPAVGFSLYLDPLAECGLGRSNRRRLFLPLGTDRNEAATLRRQGWTTVAALSETDEAGKLGCTHRYDGTNVIGLAPT